jgi:hypothetical protein
MESESKQFEFRGFEEPIVLFEDFTNDTANGTRLWEAGLLLSRYFEAYIPKIARKKILELGSGTGLLSIFLGKSKAVVLSCDYNPLVKLVCVDCFGLTTDVDNAGCLAAEEERNREQSWKASSGQKIRLGLGG